MSVERVTQLHRPELDRLLADVGEIVPIANDWARAMGFCPDALAAIAEQGARQALESIDVDADTHRNALASMYLCGFVLGVLAERAIDRSAP